MPQSSASSPATHAVLPVSRDLYYGGRWVAPAGGYTETLDPATGQSLGRVADADAQDVDRAVASAREGFAVWRRTTPAQKTAALRALADTLRRHQEELAMIDALNCGSPVKNLLRDVDTAARQIDFFAGLTTEAKGATIPAGDGALCMTVREPYGVCARLVAFNHPLMFMAGKLAAPLAAGNAVVMKPPVQAPLSALRLAELAHGLFPPGVLNILPGGLACGQALVAHEQVPVVTLIGSTRTGREVARAAADRLKHVILELGGKNALIAYPDADAAEVAAAAIKGMNFAWCGQSCGSTSRLFVHRAIHDEVVRCIVEGIAPFRPGPPTDMATTMGALISRQQLEHVSALVESARREGAQVVAGGRRPSDARLARGNFFEPTVITGVDQAMTIARTEAFGPVLAVIPWSDEEAMLAQVNSVDYGLSGAVFTRDLATAHRVADAIDAGVVWVNNTADHTVGVPFGGFKQSGYGREESIEELYEFTRTKTVSFKFKSVV